MLQTDREQRLQYEREHKRAREHYSYHFKAFVKIAEFHAVGINGENAELHLHDPVIYQVKNIVHGQP